MSADPAPAPSSDLPPVVARPKLAHLMWDRGLTLRDVAAGAACSPEQVRLCCLPFGDPKRRVPSKKLAARFEAFTKGEITRADFFPERSPVLAAANPAASPQGGRP